MENLGSKRSAPKGTGQLATKSHETAEQLKDAVVGQANQVREKVDSAQRGATERIRGVATQLKSVSETLQQEDPMVAKLAERASRGVEEVAQYVSRASAQSIARDTESLARRQPALFFGGAFLLGLVAGRFLKSSSPGYSSEGNAGWREDDADRGYGPAARGDRASGFFASEQNANKSPRYQENYAATFSSDPLDSDPLDNARQPATSEGSTLAGKASLP